MEDTQNENLSDSDSVENWILLDSNPSYNITVTPSPEQHQPEMAIPAMLYHGVGVDHDEETDGISIISDCESESAYDHVGIEEQRTEQSDETFEHISVTPDSFTSTEPDESPFEDILSNTAKLKTYVHKRNNKVSSLLNVIVLGSVLTAAGIALGHMWGIKEDCSQQTNLSINKLLSNLYKLQEENAFLRNKLKELTFNNGSQVKQKAIVGKPKKCKKVFEEPLGKVHTGKITKCVDPDAEIESSLGQYVKAELTLAQGLQDEIFERAIHDTEFKDDITKLSNIYNKNREWLDKRNPKRFNIEYPTKSPKFEKFVLNEKSKLEISEPKKYSDIKFTLPIKTENIEEIKFTNPIHSLTYADSLKQNNLNKISGDVQSNKSNFDETKIKTDMLGKRKYKPKNYSIKSENFSESINSEDEEQILQKKLKNKNKYIMEKSKNYRQQKNKKQKRKNKYEQWEMKGGYLKDYESVASLNVDEQVPENLNDKRFNYEFDMYVKNIREKELDEKMRNQNSKENKYNSVTGERDEEKSDILKNKVNKSFGLINDDWFAKRSAMRREAREELLQRNHRIKMNAHWYFRRMKDRESQRSHLLSAARNKRQRNNYKQKL